MATHDLTQIYSNVEVPIMVKKVLAHYTRVGRIVVKNVPTLRGTEFKVIKGSRV